MRHSQWHILFYSLFFTLHFATVLDSKILGTNSISLWHKRKWQEADQPTEERSAIKYFILYLLQMFILSNIFLLYVSNLYIFYATKRAIVNELEVINKCIVSLELLNRLKQNIFLQFTSELECIWLLEWRQLKVIRLEFWKMKTQNTQCREKYIGLSQYKRISHASWSHCTTNISQQY